MRANALKPAEGVPTLSFIDFLEARLRDAAPRQKGERTRERLKIATAKVMEERGYHAMRVSDITECAGVAEGSFYVYFRDKKDAALTVLTSLMEDFVDLGAPTGRAHTPFDSLRTANRRWIALCRANSGLMRCIFQLGDEEPDFGHLVQRTNRQWYERVAQAVIRRHKGGDRDSVLIAIYLLGAMMDDLVRKLIVYPDPEFHKVLKNARADDDAVADAASLIWQRVLDPDMALPGDLAPAVAKLAKWLNV